ncbi:MAG: bifunctional 4-hydroxy-2-oxoglutarate aldolase/2-dehydro-3-deoxy-phosphogluconate aldolase [Firmicutes bacterium]|nr:bifunctional 4-hydroxy-2-oxoglutarate aldolase/2-dehydro-3-deoxy-phosphogluconate aldolase [Bacillota bacterium]MDH7494733.1 bifunctional 4-hydroxy-2-oxoglutarate aldolase/2-dehydro-3-deoxy-phosphogluconate aldolase [Bacillota bacterium]
MIQTGVVAVIRAQSAESLMDVVAALRRGGLRAVEITMTTPDAIDVIRQTSRKFGDDVLVGVGSVLDPETARLAILAGAQFVVGPVLNKDVIATCRRYSKVAVPGAFTPTEILAAWEAGADVVKVFPATKLGPAYLKDVKGPLPQVLLTPTGGIDLSNAGEFIKAGACFLGVGTAMVDKSLVAEGRWDELAERARLFLDAVAQARV